jgi:cell pole-organizing protein PopZ
MRQNGEPSVEEILESIKKVIARDNRESAIEQRRRLEIERFSPLDDEADEVLELGEEAEILDQDEDGEADAPLIASEVRESMRESLAALAVLAEPGAQPQIVRSGETSLEGLAREMLRPMLAEWLDKNLPAMVEKMVAAEIARIAGKKG